MGIESEEPWGLRWSVRHPRLHLALMVFAVVWSGAWVVACAIGVGRGPSVRLVLVGAFWLLCLLSASWGVLAAVRGVRDPEGEARRRREVRQRVLDEPRDVLLRKAAVFLVVVVLGMVGTGVLGLTLGTGVVARSMGGVLVVLGVVVAVGGTWRLRHSRS